MTLNASTLSLREEKYLHFHCMDFAETITVSGVTYGKFTVSALEHKQICAHIQRGAKHKHMHART